ncbi:archaeosortase/exosortase family protein [Dysgonomonas sp. ZJ279]|uniref:archaeosortase/exosortase family protein n=1 Tax=Dysgonomonas sp. ZJ279 TaxID=2709796 RepID=UPI0013EC4E35|nr:archaeosortase/exosortase family protein [Dysgonomonas sp. ZJ279]
MDITAKLSSNKYFKIIEPFKDIIWFLFLFILFDLIWKLCVHQGVDERVLLVLGNDLTSYTDGICLWTAKAVYWTVHTLFGYSDFKIEGSTIFFDGSLRVDIIWGCTGLKQLFMFLFIMVFYFGPIKKKLWFIPLSLFILLIINILRLAIICIIIKDPYPLWFIPVNEWYNGRTWENTRASYWEFYVDWFNVFHRDVFTWLYYDGVMFVLWLIWEEKINKPFQRLKAKSAINTQEVAE